MNISKSLKNYIQLVLAGFFLAGSNYIGKISERPTIFISKQEKSLNLNNSFLTHFNLGLKSLISSSLWVATIIESDHDHYKKKDLNSWMFLRFNTISIIDPLFYENYAFGGPYLSIIKDDLPGASDIYKKGLVKFPNSFPLIRDASFHFYYEVHDYDYSKILFNKLKTFPEIPSYLIGSIARLEASNGNIEDAFLMLSELQLKFPTTTAIGKKIFDYRYSIKAEMDLNCLNGKDGKSCSASDLEGISYQLVNGIFKAQREWKPYRVK